MRHPYPAGDSKGCLVPVALHSCLAMRPQHVVAAAVS